MLFWDLDQLVIRHPFNNMNVELTLYVVCALRCFDLQPSHCLKSSPGCQDHSTPPPVQESLIFCFCTSDMVGGVHSLLFASSTESNVSPLLLPVLGHELAKIPDAILYVDPALANIEQSPNGSTEPELVFTF